MSDIRIPIELERASETMLFCLWSRAWAASLAEPLIDDAESQRILPLLRYDFRRIDLLLPEDVKLAAALRTRTLDGKTREFLQSHPRATIVNLGAGVDTFFHRVDNGLAHWIDVDSPDVMSLRSRLFNAGPRCRALAYPITDSGWMDEIQPTEDGMMFVACATLPYLTPGAMRTLIERLLSRYRGAEFVFDAYSPLQVKLQNMFVRYARMPRMYWGLRDAREMLAWSEQVDLVGQRPVFQDVQVHRPWSLRSRLLAPLYARLGFWRIVHLRFGAS
jgi:O-methyltransferase involved in polyketide biosynthesis